MYLAQKLGNAVLAEDYEAVVSLLRDGANAEMVVRDGLNSLHLAAMIHNSCALLKLLVPRVSNVDCKTASGQTALHLSARYAGRLQLETLLEYGAAVNAVDKQQNPPLLEAVRAGNIENVRILLRAGANLSLGDGFGAQAVLASTKLGRLDCATEIVSWLTKSTGGLEDVWNALHFATCTGDVKVVQHVFDGLPSRRISELVRPASCIAGVTPLHMASVLGDADIVATLLEHGCSADDVTDEGETSLHWSARAGHADVSALLLLKGAAVAPTNIYGETPLHVACAAQRIACAGLLITQGAPVDSADSAGRTPLFLSLKHGQKDTALLLLRSNVDVVRGDSTDTTPLHLIAKDGDSTLLSLVLKRGVNVNAVLKGSLRTPLHLAAAAGHVNVVDTLIEAGAKVDMVDQRGQTPLHYAASNNRVECVRTLLKRGANASKADRDGGTALHWAAGCGAAAVIALLATAGASVTVRDRFGSSPLHEAARGSHLQCVDVLLRQAQTVHLTNLDNRTPLHEAARSASGDVIRRLIAADASFNARDSTGATPFLLAVLSGNDSAVSAFLNANVSVSARDKSLRTSLHLSCELGQPRVLQQILRSLAMSPAKQEVLERRDMRGRTALITAATTTQGCATCLPLLLDAGAAINVYDNDGRSALHEAAKSASATAIGLLLARGATVNLVDRLGRTALFDAVGANDLISVVTLVENGVAILHHDVHQRTALQEARILNRLELLACLEEAELTAKAHPNATVIATIPSDTAIVAPAVDPSELAALNSDLIRSVSLKEVTNDSPAVSVISDRDVMQMEESLLQQQQQQQKLPVGRQKSPMRKSDSSDTFAVAATELRTASPSHRRSVSEPVILPDTPLQQARKQLEALMQRLNPSAH
eukprot:TRINITY_DN15622_c0_g1_i1.p1 TRINITY_DN15622_c0_g1~~TRINITY_DN15622_c0_g1_i1.p1  ORF type:complete len:883 (+),score=204.90 TRINITY_DN15622_c0_g1_i1:117-2765(+)